MNKYQEFAAKSFFRFQIWDGKANSMNQCPVENSEIVIKQFDDITITKYSLYAYMDDIQYSKDIKIEYDNNGQWEAFPDLYKDKVPALPIDFNNQIKKIRIISISGIFDSFELTLQYVFADKEAYYTKKQAEELANKEANQKLLNDSIKPEHKTGNDLVNIYWNLVNDKIEVVKINLYLVSSNETRLIGKYKETEAMFKSITGLAYGQYCYEIIEFDDSKNEVARTGKIKFVLRKPDQGKNCVTFSR